MFDSQLNQAKTYTGSNSILVNPSGTFQQAQTESISELLNTIKNVADSICKQSGYVASQIAGQNAPPPNSPEKVPAQNMGDFLREIRQMLNTADSELARTISALGQ